MELTFIFHSGFAVETEGCILILDYWMDPAGVVPPLLAKGKPVYVLASHFHEDHFSPRVLQWRKQCDWVQLILSKDILRHRRAARGDADVWMVKGDEWHDERVSIRATGSTDSGVSWVIGVDGKTLFHAGDLGNWYARFLTDDFDGKPVFSKEEGAWIDPLRLEKQYLGELKDVAKVATSFDVAMLPVDSRIGNGYTRGARQFIDRFKVGLLVPMHFTMGGPQSAHRMQEFTDPLGIRFWAIEREGERLLLE